MTPPDIAHVYAKTIVTVLEDLGWVPAGRSHVASTGIVHVVTAWNPGDERPSHRVNTAANERLYEALVDRGLSPLPARGADPDSDHVEDSWAVVGLSDDEARQLGADFRQVAVFRVTEHEQTVLACTDEWSLSRPVG